MRALDLRLLDADLVSETRLLGAVVVFEAARSLLYSWHLGRL